MKQVYAVASKVARNRRCIGLPPGMQISQGRIDFIQAGGQSESKYYKQQINFKAKNFLNFHLFFMVKRKRTDKNSGHRPKSIGGCLGGFYIFVLCGCFLFSSLQKNKIK